MQKSEKMTKNPKFSIFSFFHRMLSFVCFSLIFDEISTKMQIFARLDGPGSIGARIRYANTMSRTRVLIECHVPAC